jgi:hypothetical protein
MTDRDLIEQHVERIMVKPQAIEVRLVTATEVTNEAARQRIGLQPVPSGEVPPITITLPWAAPAFTAVKGIIHTPSPQPSIKPESRDSLLIAIAKARRWIKDICEGRTASIVEIAEREAQGERHVRLLAPLAFVSPRIIAAIIEGSAPADLTVTGLAKALPYSWAMQERRIGLPQ